MGNLGVSYLNIVNGFLKWKQGGKKMKERKVTSSVGVRAFSGNTGLIQ